MGRAVGMRVSGERSAVGAGHARPVRVRQTSACGKAVGRGQDPSLQDDDNGYFVGSGLDRPAEVHGKRLSPGRLRAGHARPLQGSKNRDTGPCGSVSLLLMRFYAFLKPTLCMNLTKAA